MCEKERETDKGNLTGRDKRDRGLNWGRKIESEREEERKWDRERMKNEERKRKRKMTRKRDH